MRLDGDGNVDDSGCACEKPCVCARQPTPTVFGPATVRCPYGWTYATRFDKETLTFRPVYDMAHEKRGEFVTVCDCPRCCAARRKEGGPS